MIQSTRRSLISVYLILLHAGFIGAFTPVQQQRLHRQSLTCIHQHQLPNDSKSFKSDKPSLVQRLVRRFESKTSNDEVQGGTSSKVLSKLKLFHDPKTYILIGIVAALKYEWLFRSPYFWFGIAFCVKWYRARYVYKIPVWDRQPNWNNVITSKDQEADLKAYTCKSCGSTIFIAKTREFFFEGTTGFGGLGCFSCGAKGKDNFVQDRDRIVEDVGDMDDYFEYERPLDFVDRAERRALMKEAKGDEEVANQILLARNAAKAAAESAVAPKAKASKKGITEETTSPAEATPSVIDAEIVSLEEREVAKAPAPETKKQSPSPKPSPPLGDDDLFDVLDLD
jgi:hypothetical protein